MSETQAEHRKPKKERSPSYPSIDLGTALTRAEQLWAREGRHYAPIQSVTEAWGYGPKSSGGRLAVAALKRFGLLEDRGSMDHREARLSELAQAILLDEREDGSERRERIRQAAMNPPIHRELWDQYQGELPSDSTLRYHLTVERGFTQGGAEEFIAQFRRTLEFAGMDAQSGKLSPLDEDSEETARTGTSPVIGVSRPVERPSPRFYGGSAGTPAPLVAMPPSAPAPIQFPVPGGTVVLQATAPLTDASFDHMIAVLQMLKPGIIVPDPEPEPVRSRDRIRVGDSVTWESQGIVQGENLKVVRIEEGSDGEEFAFVEGSDSGIPVDQLTPSD
jgi:hypothetical protein